jgi:DNA (cytosine-5)-methyltransferase 1
MLHRFITRNFRYKVKALKNGAARIYVQNAEALKAAGFLRDSKIAIRNQKNRIEIRLDPNGTNKIMDTGRGELLELKNKATADAVGHAEYVSVTFRQGKLIITVHAQDAARCRREADFVRRLSTGKPLRSGCFFSGLGMLSYHLKQGLARQGIASEIAFANDNNELAMACNLEGNPMWQHASEDVQAVVDDLAALDMTSLPEVSYVTVGYPCVAFSALAKAASRDLDHPDCGTLFIPLIAALRAMNPAFMVFENVPRFAGSQTLSLIKRALPDYHFAETVLDGHDYHELESRKRVCIVATSRGLQPLLLNAIPSLFEDAPAQTVADILSDVPLDAPAWREMAHVKRRDDMAHLGYRNCVYYGTETRMVTLPASYHAKAGVPLIGHPTQPQLQREVQPDEHARLRQLPPSLVDCVLRVWRGEHPMVGRRGSASAAHRLLGNGVSRRVWESVGASLGGQLRQCASM